MNSPDLILKAKEKEKRAKAKEKEKRAKEKEKETRAKAKEKEKRAKAKEKEKRAKAKAKEKEKRAKAKEKEKRLKKTKRVKKGGQGAIYNWESQTINDYWISYLNAKEGTDYQLVETIPPTQVDVLPIAEKQYDYSNIISDLLKHTEKKIYFGEKPEGEWSSAPGFLSSIFNTDPVGKPYVPPPKNYIFNFFGIIPVQVEYLLDLIPYTANTKSHPKFNEYYNQLVDLSKIFEEKTRKKVQKDTQTWKDNVIEKYGFKNISPSFNIIAGNNTRDGNNLYALVYMTTAGRREEKKNIYDFYGMTRLEAEYLQYYYAMQPIDEKDRPAFKDYMLDLQLVVEKINSNSSVYIRPPESRLDRYKSLIVGIFGPYSINRNLNLYNNADKDYGFDRTLFKVLYVSDLGFLQFLFKSDTTYVLFIQSIIDSGANRVKPPLRGLQ